MWCNVRKSNTALRKRINAYEEEKALLAARQVGFIEISRDVQVKTTKIIKDYPIKIKNTSVKRCALVD